jgi:hypothetical protein
MKTSYMRLSGFATNSSSSHHVIRVKSEYLNAPCFAGKNPINDFYSADFILRTSRQKHRFLAAVAYEHYQIKHKLPHEEARLLVKHQFGIDLPNGGGGDYNSEYVFPSPRVRRQSMQDLFQWLIKVIVQDENAFVIGFYGYFEEFLQDLVPSDAIENYEWFRNFSCYYRCQSEFGEEFTFLLDPLGHMVIFHRKTGHKCRIHPAGELPPARASVPELVDLKITEYCSKNCAYCLDDSSPGGKHAELWNLSHLVQFLGEWGVFEVAIGGGEPTAHPEFCSILEELSNAGIVVNFSTGSLDWFDNIHLCRAVSEYVSGVAYSIQSAQDIQNWMDHIAEFKEKVGAFPQKYVHYILGLFPISNAVDVLRVALEQDLSVVLLAPKSLGRGQDYPWHDIKNWTTILNSESAKKLMFRNQLAVDSILASQIQNGEIDPRTYEQGDGRFTLFIDAVNSRMAASSYSKETHPYKEDLIEIEECIPKIWEAITLNEISMSEHGEPNC